MKPLEKLSNKLSPLFEKGGKLSVFYPVFEMFDALLLSTLGKSEHPPFGRDSINLKKYMSLVIVALFPTFLASYYFFGWRILLMLFVSYAAGAVVEISFAVIRKHEVNEGFLVSGFIYPLILPINTPLWLVAVGIVFGILVGKEVFGGTGRNLFNPALVGRCFIALAYPAIMAGSYGVPSQSLWGYFTPLIQAAPDAISSATPLIAARSGQFLPLWDLFSGRISGSCGETSALAIIIGGVYLIAIGIANWRITFSMLLAFCGLNFILEYFTSISVSPVLYNLFSGGLLFGAFFMATDPVSGPITTGGKWAYGIIIGLLAFVIRNFSGYAEGVTFAILLGNICAPLIDQIIIQIKIKEYAHER